MLTTLVESYEAKHYPVDFPDPVEAIKFRLEQHGLETKVLDAILGGRSRTSEILSHKRGLSLNMIRKLHRQLDIPLENLVMSGTEDDNNKIAGSVRGKGLCRPKKVPKRSDLLLSHLMRSIMPETAKQLSGIQSTAESSGFRIIALRFPE